MEEKKEENMAIGTYTASDLAAHVAKETENRILEQLNDFISRGLIELQVSQPTFVEKYDAIDGYKVEIRNTVKLVLKDKEYIETLEKRIKAYENLFKEIKDLGAIK